MLLKRWFCHGMWSTCLLVKMHNTCNKLVTRFSIKFIFVLLEPFSYVLLNYLIQKCRIFVILMNNFKYSPSLLGHYADRGCVLGLPDIQDHSRAVVLRQGHLLEGQQAHHLRINHCPDNHWYPHLHHHKEHGWKRVKVVQVSWKTNLVKLFRLNLQSCSKAGCIFWPVSYLTQINSSHITCFRQVLSYLAKLYRQHHKLHALTLLALKNCLQALSCFKT